MSNPQDNPQDSATSEKPTAQQGNSQQEGGRGSRLLNVLSRLKPYSGGIGKFVALVVFAVVVSSITEPLIPALLKQLLDRGFGSNRSIALWMVPVAIIGVFAARGIASFVAKYATTALTYQIVQRLAAAQFSSLQRAHPSIYRNQTASSLANTLVYELQMGTTLLTGSLLGIAKDIFSVIALLGYLLWLNWQLTLIVLAVGPAMAWIIRIISKRLHRIAKETQSATDQLAYVVEENVLAWRMVRMHNAQDVQQQRFERGIGLLRRLALKATVASASVMPATHVLSAIAASTVIVIALWQSSSTGSSVGSFVAFVSAMLMLIGPVRGLSELTGPLMRGITSLERGLDLMEHSRKETSGQYAPAQPGQALSIAFEDVRLTYPNAEKPALDGIELHIPPGRTVALVGSSGSGKTTLVNLLPRFVDASSGHVLLGDTPIEQWQIEVLRSQFAFVSQDVVMFSDTVANNIALGDTVEENRIIAALQAANLLSFVQSLPQGIHTPVGHNANTFSGGQRQRLAIARALYKNAPIVILDEATSALDTESELAIKNALSELTAGRTTLIIAHRLSTIEHADEIVVMSEGRIVERGTHQQLITQAGHYARLHQLGSATGQIS
jgi:ATP-binding cassette, subfamily B, bacterial MsbA